MSVQVNPVHWLRELLREAGWSRRPPGFRPSPLGLEVLCRIDDTAAAIVHPPRLRPSRVGGAPLQDQFDAYLQRLLRRLHALDGDGIQVQHLFFIGNGPVTIPRSFREACTALGIRIHTVDPVRPPDSLDPFM